MKEGNQVLTAIPVYTDHAMELVERADIMLRAAASESIDMEAFPFFMTHPIGIGGVPFVDMRAKK